MADDAGGVQAAVVEAEITGHAETDRRLHADQIGDQKLTTIGAGVLAD